jgi:tetratricopeptide (TPR) repeat protein
MFGIETNNRVVWKLFWPKAETYGFVNKSVIMLALFLFANVFVAESQDDSSMDIRTLAPDEMASPTENIRAMTAYNRGTALMYESRLGEAETYFLEAIELDPMFVDAMDHLGIVYRRQNRLQEAEAVYLRSISINNKNRVPFINLAIVYRLQGRLADAFGLYANVAEISPDDPEAYYGMGEILYINGDYENAILFFDQAIELYIAVNSPYVCDAYYYKGVIYYNLNRYSEALRYLEEARKGIPNNASLDRTINEIRKILRNNL